MDDIRLDLATLNPLVLIADDDRQAQTLMHRIMEREGFRVEQAMDGQMAVERAHALMPDVILMDVQMPKIDGFEAVRLLRQDKQTERIPIIVITAAAREPSDIARGLGLGADDYLVKPFGISELIARVYSKLKARRLEDKLIKRSVELEALVKIGEVLNQGLSLDDLGDRLLPAVMEQIAAGCGFVACFDEGHILLERTINIKTPEWCAPYTLGYFVLKSGEAMLINNVKKEQSVRSIINDPTYISGIAAPLIHQGQAWGVIVLADQQPDHFKANDLQLLRSVAVQASLAVSNARLYKQLQQHAQNLESMVETRTKALQDAQTQLMRTERLAALGTLAAGIAHEVNNPLQPIMSNLEMALEDIDANRPIERELLEYASQDVQRIKRLVKRILDFARPAKTELTTTDLMKVIEEVLSLVNKQLQNTHIQLKQNLQSVGLIKGSSDQLKQVILNLIVNAMDAMPNGGTLTLNTYEQDNFAVIDVCDTGVGIP